MFFVLEMILESSEKSNLLHAFVITKNKNKRGFCNSIFKCNDNKSGITLQFKLEKKFANNSNVLAKNAIVFKYIYYPKIL